MNIRNGGGNPDTRNASTGDRQKLVAVPETRTENESGGRAGACGRRHPATPSAAAAPSSRGVRAFPSRAHGGRLLPETSDEELVSTPRGLRRRNGAKTQTDSGTRRKHGRPGQTSPRGAHGDTRRGARITDRRENADRGARPPDGCHETTRGELRRGCGAGASCGWGTTPRRCPTEDSPETPQKHQGPGQARPPPWASPRRKHPPNTSARPRVLRRCSRRPSWGAAWAPDVSRKSRERQHDTRWVSLSHGGWHGLTGCHGTGGVSGRCAQGQRLRALAHLRGLEGNGTKRTHRTRGRRPEGDRGGQRSGPGVTTGGGARREDAPLGRGHQGQWPRSLWWLRQPRGRLCRHVTRPGRAEVR